MCRRANAGWSVFPARSVFAALLICAWALATPVAAQSLSFSSDEALSTDTGHVLVEWNGTGDTRLDLRPQDGELAARTLYAGRNRSFFVSGLPDGEYDLILSDSDGQKVVQTLSVGHQSLTQALWLTLIGAIITAGIVFTIVRGARDE